MGSLTSDQCGTGGRRGHGHHGRRARAAQSRQWAWCGCCCDQRCGHGRLEWTQLVSLQCLCQCVYQLQSPIPSHTSFVATGHAATAAVVGLTGLAHGSLLGSFTLAMAGNGTVNGPGRRRRGSVRVEFRVIACTCEGSMLAMMKIEGLASFNCFARNDRPRRFPRTRRKQNHVPRSS